ncbi:DUF1924 domain-containing protein [Roseobacter sp. S98]|uniref:DUF1924 domain-containing protein n=1 Tax=Roseobacter algicola (ex Choi et al. 2025) (nom. illeg.) TaxID=3092138 RepID=UPI0035C66CBB
MKHILIAIALLLSFLGTTLHAGGVDDLINYYMAQAKSETQSFAGFDADRGEELYLKEFSSGKPDTPSCTSCHTNDPTQVGETRAGKAIDPMAVSVSPERYQTLKKAEKWFGRNCRSVLGRECTAIEKGDFLSFMKGL